ncbi:MAG: MATE family efflux transporter [Chloroflexi bacterium]|nr:MATE family efflux transporter [Chloroflexota bacterium]
MAQERGTGSQNLSGDERRPSARIDEPQLAGGAPGAEATLEERETPREPAGEGGGRRRSSYASRDLTTGSIRRNLVFLAWPQVTDGALNVLDQLLDIFWAGRGIGARAIAGIGVAQNYIMFIRLGRQGIDMSMRAMVARSVGAGDLRMANHVVLQAVTINLILAFLAMVPGIIFTEFLLRILGMSSELIALAKGYMQIQFLASLTQGFRIMSGAALQASGDTLTPMKATLTARVMDWILTPFLMFGWLGFPALGLNGVAWVNALSGFIGFAINSYGLLTGSSRLHLTFRGYYLDFPLMGRMLKVGIPASVIMAERALTQLIVIGIVARFGDYALAAYALVRRVEMVAMLGGQGLGNACGVISGQSIGAGRPERARQTVRWAMVYVVPIMAILGALFLAFPRFFLSIFNQEPELLAVADTWLRILVVSFLVLAPGQIFQQTFQISGDTVAPMVVVIITMWFVEIPTAVILSGVAQTWSIFGWTPPLPTITSLGQFGVAWAVVLGMGVRLLLYTPYFFWGPWMHKDVG